MPADPSQILRVIKFNDHKSSTHISSHTHKHKEDAEAETIHHLNRQEEYLIPPSTTPLCTAPATLMLSYPPINCCNTPFYVSPWHCTATYDATRTPSASHRANIVPTDAFLRLQSGYSSETLTNTHASQSALSSNRMAKAMQKVLLRTAITKTSTNESKNFRGITAKDMGFHIYKHMYSSISVQLHVVKLPWSSLGVKCLARRGISTLSRVSELNLALNRMELRKSCDICNFICSVCMCRCRSEKYPMRITFAVAFKHTYTYMYMLIGISVWVNEIDRILLYGYNDTWTKRA